MSRPHQLAFGPLRSPAGATGWRRLRPSWPTAPTPPIPSARSSPVGFVVSQSRSKTGISLPGERDEVPVFPFASYPRYSPAVRPIMFVRNLSGSHLSATDSVQTASELPNGPKQDPRARECANAPDAHTQGPRMPHHAHHHKHTHSLQTLTQSLPPRSPPHVC